MWQQVSRNAEQSHCFAFQVSTPRTQRPNRPEQRKRRTSHTLCRTVARRVSAAQSAYPNPNVAQMFTKEHQLHEFPYTWSFYCNGQYWHSAKLVANLEDAVALLYSISALPGCHLQSFSGPTLQGMPTPPKCRAWRSRARGPPCGTCR